MREGFLLLDLGVVLGHGLEGVDEARLELGLAHQDADVNLKAKEKTFEASKVHHL